MTSNSQHIIQSIHQEFEMLIEFVTGEQAQQATADQIERGLFALLLALGAKLLQLFFVMRSEQCNRDKIKSSTGLTLPYHRDAKRDYYSIFGKLSIERPYFYKKGVGREIPLDAELALGQDCYSDFLREISDYLGVYNVYHKTSDILERILKLLLSTGAIETNIDEDAADVEAYYAQKSPPAPSQEAEILVIQADGKGVPLILEEPTEPQVRLGKGQKRGCKKEAIVTTVYTIETKPRTPAEVVDSYYHLPQSDTRAKPASPKPQHKHIWATLDGKDVALARLAKQVTARDGEHIQHRVVLCDGCEALQTRLINQFPDFTLILDFIHANEYLWDVANCLLGENDLSRENWMADHTLKLLSGQTKQVVASFRQMVQDDYYTTKQQAQLEKTANYFERNLPYMDYHAYLQQGWPIASGVIEGACRHFVKDRCELSGMRWSQPGVESLLRLRAVAENGDWDQYHQFRKRQQYIRLYGKPYPEQIPLEFQAIEDNSLSTRNSSQTSDQLVEPAISPNNRNLYYELPLAA